MIGRCQGNDTFVAFQPMGISVSEETVNSLSFQRCHGEYTFFQRCLQSLYFSRSPPPILSSLLFSAGFQFSCNSIRTFNDRMKIRRNRGLWTVYDRSVGVTKRLPPPKKITRKSLELGVNPLPLVSLPRRLETTRWSWKSTWVWTVA